MTELLIRRETLDDLKVAANAAHFSGVDTFTDPKTGLLGLVAIQEELVDGVVRARRVCQQCGGAFNEGDPRLRMTPVYMYPDAPPIGLHAKCEVPPARIFTMFRGLEIRRRFASIVKGSLGLDKARSEADNRIIR